MSRYGDYLYVIPEDDADRQIAVGFEQHDQVNAPRIQVMPPAGGWSYVLRTFQNEYVQKLRDNTRSHVVMLVDFDDQIQKRRKDFEEAIPEDLRSRVFVIGPQHTPEMLKKALNKSFEEIGKSLADNCYADTSGNWDHEQLQHNHAERERLVQTVKSFLFQQPA